MQLDHDTIKWLGTIQAKTKNEQYGRVGNGNYGLMEVTKDKDGKEERTVRFIGFKSTEHAQAFAEFISIQRQTYTPPLPDDAIERGQAMAKLQEMREMLANVELRPFAMMYSVPDSALNEIFDRSASQE